MEPRLQLAADQLARMRAMNGMYHARFFADIRFTLVVELALFVAGYAIDRRIMLAIPVVALMGATQTAFDASYLIFSRQYATRLEQFLNRAVGEDVLIAHRMEDDYLFPLDRTKVVTLPLGSPMTWFGFMTFFYTALGAGTYIAGLIASWPILSDRDFGRIAVLYGITLLGLTAIALAYGFRWFVSGEGERRLREVFENSELYALEAGGRKPEA
jgi:hypothetical protein